MNGHISGWDAYQYTAKIIGRRKPLIGVFFAPNMEVAEQYFAREFKSYYHNELKSYALVVLSEAEFKAYEQGGKA